MRRLLKNTLAMTLGVTLGSVFLWSCNSSENGGNEKATDTATSGGITIAVDESLKPAVQAAVDAFNVAYPKAKVTAIYMEEQQAVNQMLADSARLAIVTRDLTETEQQQLAQQNYKARFTAVAREAIAIIANRSVVDTNMPIARLKSILSGEIYDWSSFTKDKKGTIEIVLTSAESSTVRFLSDSILMGKPLKVKVKSVKSSEEIIGYVKANPNALGLLGVSYIADGDDWRAKSFAQSIRVLALESKGRDEQREEFPFVQPYQAYLKLNIYPLRRNVIVHSREARAGLGTGFASYLASSQGQLVFLKAGVLPANIPPREVRIKNVNPYDK